MTWLSILALAPFGLAAVVAAVRFGGAAEMRAGAALAEALSQAAVNEAEARRIDAEIAADWGEVSDDEDDGVRH